LKFTPPDGTITVRTSERPGEVWGRDLLVEVTDTGIGIPAEVLPRIFGRFEQGALYIGRRYGGLGFAVAIARSIIELHGGSISAHSAGEGKGAVFTVRLPGAESTVAAAEAPAVESAAGVESEAGAEVGAETEAQAGAEAPEEEARPLT